MQSGLYMRVLFKPLSWVSIDYRIYESFHQHSKIQTYFASATFLLGPGSVVAIATGYGMDGPRIESGWGEIFRTYPDRPWGPPSLPYNGYRVFLGGKERPRRDADPSPPSSVTVKKE